MVESKFFGVSDVMEILECSETYAYKVIALLNEELEAQGYLIIRGKIPKAYLLKRLYLGE